MTRGRKPKPTALKLITGIPGKRPLNQHEAKAGLSMDTPPEYLSENAKEHWRDIAPTLINMGLLTDLDRDIVAAYCDTFARWNMAREMLINEPLILEAPSGYRQQNPLIGIINKAQDQMIKIAVEFGMTASSRSRVQVQPPDDPDKGFKKFLK